MARAKKKINIGVIGCGKISYIYFKNLTGMFEFAEVTACADIVPAAAKKAAAEYKIKALTVKQLLADKSIDIILNLTIPAAHFEVAMAAVKAGKSVYNEKPLTLTMEEADELAAAAEKKGVLVGCAPDTFMGGGIQTCCKLINDGWIGTPVAATAFMMGHGPEGWHPNPEFYYKVGGGPMFDMGPYYLTALVSMLGPVARVAGATGMGQTQRKATCKEKYGLIIDVDVPTHVAGLLNFKSGAIGTIITSFDVWASELPRIEIYGTAGTLSVPDPNTFGGKIRIKRAGAEDWTEMALSNNYSENSRGVGIADMAKALMTGRKHRASCDLARHVLEIMHALHTSSDNGRYSKIKSPCKQPATMPMGLLDGELD